MRGSGKSETRQGRRIGSSQEKQADAVVQVTAPGPHPSTLRCSSAASLLLVVGAVSGLIARHRPASTTPGLRPEPRVRHRARQEPGAAHPSLAPEPGLTEDGPHPPARVEQRCDRVPGVILAGRATSEPFTTVVTGPWRIPTDNTNAASTCSVSRLRR